MAITVKYFAAVREQMGRPGDTVDFHAGMSARDVWSAVNEGNPMPDRMMLAVNMQMEKPDTVLSDGDEVAFFPTVTGG